MTIDVSELPSTAIDHRSPIWWGNLMLLFIETTMFALVVAGYFYVHQNIKPWPPPRIHLSQPLLNPVPKLGIPMVNLILLLISLIPMIWADYAAWNYRQRAVTIALILSVLIGAGNIVLRFYEFPALHFRWDENAYASFAWTILGMHLLHLMTGTLENSLMLSWLAVKGLDAKHARDIRVTGVYWYWIVGIWIVLYAIVYLSPRFL
jgi:cytochrome c oxidase subunit III